MSNVDKALFTGFIIGAIILGIAGFLLAPHLLALAGVTVVSGQIVYPVGILSWQIPSAIGITSAVFGNLQAGIAVFMGLIGGLTGGLIGIKTSKKENSSTLQHTPSYHAVHINNAKTDGYSPQPAITGKTAGKSFVESYKLEKSENREISANR